MNGLKKVTSVSSTNSRTDYSTKTTSYTELGSILVQICISVTVKLNSLSDLHLLIFTVKLLNKLIPDKVLNKKFSLLRSIFLFLSRQ